MKLPHAPDWLAYLAVAAALAALAVGVPWRSGKPTRVRLAMPAVNGQALAPASLFDPAIWVSAPPAGPGAGTAFSVAESGVWLTARHVVDGCASTVIVTSPGHGVAARARLWPGRETAVLYTRGGAPALPIAPAEVLRRGQRAFHPGFPGSRPGEARSELARRATLAQAGVKPLDGPGEAMTAASYGAVADDLRGRLSVAEVECLGS